MILKDIENQLNLIKNQQNALRRAYIQAKQLRKTDIMQKAVIKYMSLERQKRERIGRYQSLRRLRTQELLRFKEESRLPIAYIKEQQAKHADDILQPRIEGELNPAYLKKWGTQSLNISDHDVAYIAKKEPSLVPLLDEARRAKENANNHTIKQ